MFGRKFAVVVLVIILLEVALPNISVALNTILLMYAIALDNRMKKYYEEKYIKVRRAFSSIMVILFLLSLSLYFMENFYMRLVSALSIFMLLYSDREMFYALSINEIPENIDEYSEIYIFDARRPYKLLVSYDDKYSLDGNRWFEKDEFMILKEGGKNAYDVLSYLG